MANEKLLIDLWSVNMNEVDTSDCTDVEDILSAVITYLSELPNVDAVPVVRCKDCVHYNGEGCLNTHGEFEPEPTFFCAYGERKDNG